MKQILLVLTLFLMCSVPMLADVPSSSFSPKEIPVVPVPERVPNKDNTNRPRVPARVPLTCFLMDDCLTVVCDYEAEGEVTVTNNVTGMVVASETGELAAGIVLYLTDYTEGAMTVTITLNDKGYIGYF